jgi:hypothetical protein
LLKVARSHRKCECDEAERSCLRVTVQHGVDMICEARHQIGVDIDFSATSRTVFPSERVTPRGEAKREEISLTSPTMNISRLLGAPARARDGMAETP